MQLHREALLALVEKDVARTVELALKCLDLDPTFEYANDLIVRALMLCMLPHVDAPSYKQPGWGKGKDTV